MVTEWELRRQGVTYTIPTGERKGMTGSLQLQVYGHCPNAFLRINFGIRALVAVWAGRLKCIRLSNIRATNSAGGID